VACWRYGVNLTVVLKKWIRGFRLQSRSCGEFLQAVYSYSIQKLRPDGAVPLDIEIWPSATFFETGSTLRLTIQGHDAARYPGFRHRKLVNRGRHTIFTGGRYDSCLTVPLKR